MYYNNCHRRNQNPTYNIKINVKMNFKVVWLCISNIKSPQGHKGLNMTAYTHTHTHTHTHTVIEEPKEFQEPSVWAGWSAPPSTSLMAGLKTAGEREACSNSQLLLHSMFPGV